MVGWYGGSARAAALFDPVESAVHHQLVLKAVVQRHGRGRPVDARAYIQHQAAAALCRPL